MSATNGWFFLVFICGPFFGSFARLPHYLVSRRVFPLQRSEKEVFVSIQCAFGKRRKRCGAVMFERIYNNEGGYLFWGIAKEQDLRYTQYND
jgi:hypothetical protein